MSERQVKQVIVIRRDLRMRRGKEVAQGAHASMAWLAERVSAGHDMSLTSNGARYILLSQAEMAWLDGAFTKVTCQVAGLEELEALHQRALGLNIMARLITDAGRTEFGGVPTVTALAVGPDWSDVVDQVTGGLSLY